VSVEWVDIYRTLIALIAGMEAGVALLFAYRFGKLISKTHVGAGNIAATLLHLGIATVCINIVYFRTADSVDHVAFNIRDVALLPTLLLFGIGMFYAIPVLAKREVELE